jgi:hypothetical protein
MRIEAYMKGPYPEVLTTREEGAVAVVVAVFISFVALALGSLAFDGGSLWQSQRTMVTHSDAMAHGGAVRMMEALRANEGCLTQAEVADEVAGVRDLNDASDQILDVYAKCDPATFSGLVQVQARGDSDRYFAPTDDLTAFGTSAVDFKPRIRPAKGWSICESLFAGGVLNTKFRLGDTGNIYAFPYTKAEEILAAADAGTCPSTGNLKSANNAPGVWGWLIDECVPTSPIVASFECQGEVGNDELKAFQGLSQEERTMYLPIFEEVKGTGNATKNPARFKIIGQAHVVLLGDCNITGNQTITACEKTPYEQKFTGQANYLIFEFKGASLYRDGRWSDIIYDGFEVAFCDSDTSLTWCS